jgi:hypothetical protein
MKKGILILFGLIWVGALGLGVSAAGGRASSSTAAVLLFFSKTSPLLDASGGTFRPGAPESAPPPATGSRGSEGRLPSTLAPTPSHP